jgi:hypothetical protein
MARDEFPVGREKAPSWENICFQLENFISPVGNMKLRVHCVFGGSPYILTFNGIRNMGLKGVKIFDIEL